MTGCCTADAAATVAEDSGQSNSIGPHLEAAVEKGKTPQLISEHCHCACMFVVHSSFVLGYPG